MLNPHIFDLVIINNDSKEVHFGSGATGSCNLAKMGKASHSIEIVYNGDSTDSAARRLVAQGYSICKHCIHNTGLSPDIDIARYI